MNPARGLLTSRRDMAFLGPSLRRARVSERPLARFGVALLVSLVANAVILLAAWRMGAFELPKPVREQQVVLAPLTADQWRHNQAIAGQPLPPGAAPLPKLPLAVAPPAPMAPPPKPPPHPPVEKDDLNAPGRIVDVAPSKDSTPPKDARFYSDRDNSVKKETRSRDAGKQVYKNRAEQRTEGEDRRQEQAREASQGGAAKEAQQAKKGPDVQGGSGAEKPPTPPAEKDRLALLEPKQGEGLAPPRPRPPAPTSPREGSQGLPGLPGAPAEAQKPGDARLVPSASSMSKVMAGPSNDDLRDTNIEEGDGTALNTRSFKHAAFFNRVFQSIEEQWRPGDVYLARDPRLTTFPLRDRATTFQMTLEPNGEIRTLRLLESCGLDFLDRELVRAIRAAAPFENVPAELAAKGKITFPPETFVLILPKEGGIQLRFVPPDAREPLFQ